MADSELFNTLKRDSRPGNQAQSQMLNGAPLPPKEGAAVEAPVTPGDALPQIAGSPLFHLLMGGIPDVQAETMPNAMPSQQAPSQNQMPVVDPKQAEIRLRGLKGFNR